MKFHVMTIFPEMIKDILKYSILGKAKENDLIDVEVLDIRDFSLDKHKKTDDYTFGGGAGMLMTPQPIYSAFKEIESKIEGKAKRVIYVTPQGKPLTQEIAKELSKEGDIIILCGHYEGVDQRVIDLIVTDEISIGDYVLTGGELPACIIIDSVARLVEGVLNKEESHEIESFENNLLEYPQYTRPREFEGLEVPSVLLSGNHKEIEKWRLEKSIEKTKKVRPELLKK